MEYFSIPLKKSLTLVFVGSKKLLFNCSKKRVEIILERYLNKKNLKKGNIDSQYSDKLFVNNLDTLKKIGSSRKEKNYKNKFSFIVNSKNWIDKDFLKRISVISLESYLKLNHSNRNVKNEKLYIAVGRIFDEQFIKTIKENKKKIENIFCLLIGLEDFYFFRINDNICFDCLRTRRAAKLSNMAETVLAEKYLHKTNSSNIFIDELFELATKWITGLNINAKEKKIITYRKKNNSFSRSKLIAFPLCANCGGNSCKRPFLTRDLLDNNLGLFSFFPNYSKKINNQKLHIISSQLSQLAPIVHLELYKKQKSFNEIKKFFVSNLNKFSVYRPVICGAVSLFSPKIAQVKAIGESIERYAAILFDRSKLIRKRFISCRNKAVSPKDWVLYNNKQYDSKGFPFEKFSEETLINWVEGVSLLSGKTRLVPASFVYIRYPVLDIGIYPTTGLACGRNCESVMMNGIFENLERDACMLTWLLKILPQRIVNISNEKIITILRDFSVAGIEIHLFQISLDFNLPVVLAIGINRDNVKDCPRVLIGSSCNAEKDKAIIKSIEEMGQGLSWIHLTKRCPNYDFGENFKNITHFEHRAIFYATLKNTSILDFILNTKRQIEYGAIKTGISNENILKMIEKNGYDIIEVSLTTADIRSAGYIVNKIMIPGLQPLNSNHNLNYLGRRRINKVVEYLKSEKIDYSKNINLLPHPFT